MKYRTTAVQQICVCWRKRFTMFWEGFEPGSTHSRANVSVRTKDVEKMTWSLWKRCQFPEFWGFVVDMIEEVVWLSVMLWNHTTLGPDLGPFSKSCTNVVILGQGLFWASLQPSSAYRVKNNTKQTHYTSITRGPVFDDKGENMWMQSCSENLRNQSNTFLWFGLYDSPALWALLFKERLIRVRMFSS